MSTSKLDSDVGWIYEGQKSSVDAEEYLTGRRVDKHFDQHCSDFKPEQSKVDSVARAKFLGENLRGGESALDLETIKKEDPLVAIRVKEELMRREIFDNPLKMKRFRKIVMSAMRKKMNKMARRGQLAEFFKIFESNVAPEKAENLRDSTASDESDSSSSFARGHSPKLALGQKRTEKSRRDSRERPSREGLDSDNSDDRGGRKNDFGLVYLNSANRAKRRAEISGDDEFSVKKPDRISSTNEKSKKSLRGRLTRKLTDAEMEAKRREMMDNAKWRDERRNERRRKFESDERDEERESGRENSAHFLKPMISNVMNAATVEDRIRSKKHSLQRRHDAMDTHFARK